MIAFGIYLAASHSVQQIAADAARTAIAGLDQTERQQLANTYVGTQAAGYPFVNPSKLTVVTRDINGNTNQFLVVLEYDAASLPIWNLVNPSLMPSMTIKRNSTILIGGI